MHAISAQRYCNKNKVTRNLLTINKTLIAKNSRNFGAAFAISDESDGLQFARIQN